MNIGLLKKLTADVSLEERVSEAEALINNDQDISKNLNQEDLEELDMLVKGWIKELESGCDETRFKNEEIVQKIHGLFILVETIVEMNSLYNITSM